MTIKGLQYGRGFLGDPIANNTALNERQRAKDNRQRSQVSLKVHTSAVTVGPNDYVRCDPSTAGFTVTLPSAQSLGAGEVVSIKNTTSSLNTITIATVRSELIDGASTYSMVLPYQELNLTSTKDGWVIS